MVLAIMVELWLAQAGCTKDTDCKGDRICEAGVCVSPKAPAGVDLVAPPSPPPPPPPPSPPPAPAEEWPRVVRRDGLVCVQAPGADGRIEESCRKEEPLPAQRRPSPLNGAKSVDSQQPYDSPSLARHGRRATAEDEPREPAARFVVDVLLQGGVTLLTGSTFLVAVPEFTGLLSFGARFRSGIGVVGLGNVHVFGNSNALAFAATVAPGLRFGNESHFTLGAGPAFVAFGGSGTSGSGVMGSIVAQGVFALNRHFGFCLQGGLLFDASAAFFTLGGGIGFGAF